MKHHTTLQRLFILLATAAILVGSATAATLTVENTNDSGTGSLRDTIAAASSGDTITFTNTLAGQSILLTSGQLTVSNNLTINASAIGGITIDGNASGRIFEIVANTTNVFEHLTLTNGLATGSHPADRGGAIYINSGAELHLTHCTLTDNTATSAGGAIFQLGVLTLNNSTLCDNYAGEWGGGIYNFISSSSLTLNNSTLSGNGSLKKGGGIFIESGTVSLNNATLSDNYSNDGGGIFKFVGSINSANSIIAENTAVMNTNINTSISSNNLTSGDPLLAPLGDYGGPTHTMPPLPGSPAIDMGGSTSLTNDQRGFARVINGTVDMGAVETTYSTHPAIVTSTGDLVDTDTTNSVSLREAIAFSTNGTTITFAPALVGQTITLTSGQILIDKALTIDASAIGGITIDASDASPRHRVMQVNDHAVTLRGLTITGGSTLGSDAANSGGAGILHFGGSNTLTIDRCTIHGNHATGVNGAGGALFNYGPLNIVNSTFTDNRAVDYSGRGAVIFMVTGTASLSQCTLAGNGPGDAAIRLNASTGIAITNSIVSDNSGIPSTTGPGTVNSLISSLTSGNPLLAPLGDYGGPTHTMPPLLSSPAIDAGGSTALTTDQRGFARVAGSSVDIGAVEWEPSLSPITVDIVADENGSLTDGISLREAIDFAAGFDDSVIEFDPSLSGQTLVITNGQLSVDNDLTIDASDLEDGLTLSGGNTNRLFAVETAGILTLNNLHLKDAYSGFGNSGTGGGIRNKGTLNLNDSSITDCVAEGNGGGLFITDTGTVVINRSTFSANTSAGSGGGIYSRGILNMLNSTIAENTATNTGGGIHNATIGTLILNHCTLSANTASSQGGGIASSGTSALTNTIVCGNTASSSENTGTPTSSFGNLIDDDALLAPLGDYGGPTHTMPPLFGSPAINAGETNNLAADQRGAPRDALPDIGAAEDRTIVLNTDNAGVGSLRNAIANSGFAPTNHPSITFDPALAGQSIVLTNGQILIDEHLNIDASAIGGITIDGSASGRIFEIATYTTNAFDSLTLTNGLASGFNKGGAILINIGADLHLTHCTLSGNAASYQGGGIYNDNFSSLTLNNCTLSNNSSDGNGGGIYQKLSSSLTLNNSTLSGNSCDGYAVSGGGIYSQGTLTLNNSTLSDNSTEAGNGGGIYSLGTLTLNNSTLYDNSSNDPFNDGGLGYGGGIYKGGGMLVLTNSIVAGNTADSDHNIRGTPDSSVNSLISGDPLLAPLGDYAGPTLTCPPLPGSPAIDAGGSTTLTNDQRGFVRVINGTADVGAVETTYSTHPAVVTSPGDLVDTDTTNSVSLREAIAFSTNGTTISFAPALTGQTIVLTNGQILIDKNIDIDASSIGGITIDGNGLVTSNRIFKIAASTTNVFDSLTLTNGLATGNFPDNIGGAIWISSGAELSLQNSTLSGNSADFGGGIYGVGTLSVAHSTLSGNSADSGGGIYGEIASSLSVAHSTLSGNSANIGGGIYTDGFKLNLTNSIVADNFSSAGGNIFGMFTAQNSLTTGNPLLAPLGDYGGPTETMPPLPGSPAINAGLTSATNSLTDQRGLTRVVGSSVDIGAVEFDLGGAPILVNTVTDENALPNDDLSLREAIDFASGFDDAAITFTSALSGGSITLSNGQISITTDLTIDASGLQDGLALSGGNANRLFSVGVGASLHLDSIWLKDGYAGNRGGAITTQGSLHIENCTFSDNTAVGDGGAIMATSNDPLNPIDSLFTNCTFSSNVSSNRGGALFNAGTNSSVVLSHCTLSGNQDHKSPISVETSGGVAARNNLSGPVILHNSILYGNTSFGVTPRDVAGNSITNTGTSIIGAGTPANQGTILTADPLLAPLGDYGGPTPTMPPLFGSPAINAGATNNLAADQRGTPRFDGMPDIGAVESQSIVRNLADAGSGSLRDAIDWAPGGDTISFTNALSGQTIVLTSGQILLDKSLTISASNLLNGISIDGNNSSRIFKISGGTTSIFFDSLTLTNGLASGSFPNDRGGAILINSGADLLITDCTLTGNTAGGGFGGAIYNNSLGFIGIPDPPSNTLTLNNSTLTGNTASSGGAIYNANSGMLTLNSSTLADNTASSGGGGGIVNGGKLMLNSSTLTGNTTTNSFVGGIAQSGGGIRNGIFSILTLTNSIVSGNTADLDDNISGTPDSSVNSLTNGVPLLAPLGDYGGLTQTMPPLPGSPAIDAGGTTTLTTDQRGFVRVIGSDTDIGAVEFQGDPDYILLGPANLATIWHLDSDGDGNAFGVEHANGTDWATSDAGNFAALSTGGAGFGFNPAATNQTAWVLKRSLDLVSDPFVEIYRYDGPTDTTTTNIPVSVNMTASGIEVQDLTGATNAYYQFEAEVSP